MRDIRGLLDSLGRHRTPPARLEALVRELTSQRELAARYGCPFGSLCSESMSEPTAPTLLRRDAGALD